MAEYERHEPEKTLLDEVVREQLKGFLARSSVREQLAPRFIEQEVRAFLRCGVLSNGFLRLHCDACGHDRLVAIETKTAFGQPHTVEYVVRMNDGEVLEAEYASALRRVAEDPPSAAAARAR